MSSARGACRSSSASTNPFNSTRINFPSFDEALYSKAEKAAETEADDSILSSSSMANLSIGARAALTEQLALISRLGIDSSRDDAAEECASDDRDPLDIKWQSLINANISYISMANASFQTLASPIRLDRVCSNINDAGEEEIEIMAETSSDYFNDSDFFNSSRVLMLKTPERLYNVHAHSQKNDLFACQNRSSHCKQHREPDYMHSGSIFQDDMHTDEHSEFNSLAAADISHISADGSEAHMKQVCSPDCSFIHDNRPSMEAVASPTALSFTSPVRSVSQMRQDSKRSSPRSKDHLDYYISASKPLSALRRSPPRLILARSIDKENNPLYDTAHTTISSAASCAAEMAMQYMHQSSSQQSINCDRMPPSLSLGTSRNVPSKRLPAMELEITRNIDTSTLRSTSSENKSSLTNTSSSISSQDRRLYRTVVPPRVFLTENTEFPEQHDSFSVPVRRGSPLARASSPRTCRSGPY
jgi:hypothetical protein